MEIHCMEMRNFKNPQTTPEAIGAPTPIQVTAYTDSQSPVGSDPSSGRRAESHWRHLKLDEPTIDVPI